MKKLFNKKTLIIFIIVIAIVSTFIFFILNFKDQKTNLTILEKRWIEQNKEKVIDISIINDVPILGEQGSGIFFSFLDDFEKDTGLEFNRIPYDKTSSTPNSEYNIKTSDIVSENDLSLYIDNYILIGKTKSYYNNIRDIKNITIGVLHDDLEVLKYYLTDSSNVNYVEYENKTKLMEALNNKEVDTVCLQYLLNIDNVILDKDLFINYKIFDMRKNYIITLSSSNTKLNSIIKKYYLNWEKNTKTSVFNKLAREYYFDKTNLSEKTINTFTSKKYVYGYVNNLPFDNYKNDSETTGMMSNYLKNYTDFSNAEFTYQKFNNISELRQAVQNGVVDVALNYYNENIDNSSITNTISMFDNKIVILSKGEYIYNINSLKSLENKEVSVVESTDIHSIIKNNSNALIKTYSNIDDLFTKSKENSILAIDFYTYMYYKNTKLSDYNVLYLSNVDTKYSFVLNNKEDNNTFNNMFNYFMTFTNSNVTNIEGYSSLMAFNSNVSFGFNVMIIPYILVILLLLIIIYILLKRKITIKKLDKKDKLKYIDALTSLKNRTYLNDYIPKWDSNNIYPQTIVIVDLNNIKFINDNYGYEEGDKIIGFASSILINNQIENSDIIRTDGNEFLIYLIGYNEKQVITFMRKIYKELKTLPYNFGAALGYSMRYDEVKTIEDTINEASISMRENKELTKNN